MFISAIKKDDRRPKLSRQFFIQAVRHGHLLSIMMFMHGCWRGAFGPVFRLIGIVGWPFSVLLVWVVMWFRPFDRSVFAYPTGSSRPLFKTSTFSH